MHNFVQFGEVECVAPLAVFRVLLKKLQVIFSICCISNSVECTESNNLATLDIRVTFKTS